MDRELAIYVVSCIALIILGALRATSNLSESNFMQGFMFILGALFGGGVMYLVRRLEHK
jgi:hypothetical protein